ncbi:MAG: DUF11 domain-containing protein, partial [Notoacmeibacter sp.]|nr:DUF11 domain-containing protein [Notoacmeibacter sp.]
TAIGTPAGDPPVTDVSDNGIDTDGKTTDDPTVTSVTQLPSIGAAKTASASTANADGTFDVEYTIVVANTGTVNLANLQLVDDLTAANQLGSAFTASDASDTTGGILTAPLVSLTNTSGLSVAPSANTAYDGTGNLLAGTDGLLAPGDRYEVRFSVRIDPYINNAPLTYLNQALAQGHGPSGAVVSDLTDNGTDPTSNPGNPGSGNPTPVELSLRQTGVVYDSTSGAPVSGATINLVNANGQRLANACFRAPSMQSQVTGIDGRYSVFIIPGADATCPESSTDYRIEITPPAGYATPPSSLHEPNLGIAELGPCVIDQLPGGPCDISAADTPPAGPASLAYYLGFSTAAGDPILSRNHIPLDPFAALSNISITKVANPRTIRRGESVSYTITVTNQTADDAGYVRIIDRLPAGFVYVASSATINGTPVTPTINGNTIDFGLIPLGPNAVIEILLTARATAAAGPGEYANRAFVEDESGSSLAPPAVAVVEIIPEPVFDCTDIIGKVFEDRNGNGYQDSGESGLAGVRLASAKGWLIKTDEFGRFHVPCAALPDGDIGSNFILKLDTRTLPVGYRLTTENPRVIRVTAGKMSEMNFGARKLREVRVDLSDKVFVPGTANLSPEWSRGIDRLVKVLSQETSYLKVTYRTWLGSPESKARMINFERQMQKAWKEAGSPYPLEIDVTRERLQ